MRMSSSSARTRAAPAPKIAWLSARISRFIDICLLPRNLSSATLLIGEGVIATRYVSNSDNLIQNSASPRQSLSNQYDMFCEPLSTGAQSNHIEMCLNGVREV